MKNSYLKRTLEFHKIYQEEILPIFSSYEFFRKKELLLWWLYTITAIFLILMPLWCFPVFILIFEWKQEISGFSMFIMAILWCIGLLMLYKMGNRSKNFAVTIKTDCLPRLLKVFGDVKWVNDSNIISDYNIHSSGLFANYNRRETDDEFQGTFNGIPFKICETSLWYESGSGKNRTIMQIFKGVIISFKSNKIIKNRTIISTKGDLTKKNSYLIYIAMLIYPVITLIMDYKNIISWGAIILITLGYALIYRNEMKEQEALEPVLLEDPKFCNRYNVYSSDQIEARYLVTTAFMERFQKLNTSFGAHKAKCSFCGDEIIFAISTKKNLFEIGSLFTSLKKIKSINDFYNELSSIFELAEYFKLDEKTGL